SRRRHTRSKRDWSSDVCSSDLTFVVGNIGTAYTGMALQTKEDSVVVAEISSFQLESAITFHPHVSAILNITPDHLDRHKTMECYIAVKESITDRKSTRLNSSHVSISYAVFCLKKK